MLAKRIIPCLDVRNGRVVKGTRFAEIQDAGDPVELAAFYDLAGADEIVFYDITASAEGRRTMIEVARRAAEQVFIPFTVGGGVSDVQQMRALLSAGADKISINSAAVRRPDLINEGAERFGSQCVVLSIDCLRRTRPDGSVWWEVVIDGGRVPTGMDVLRWAEEGVRRGAGELVLNSIDADGTKDGYDNDLNRTVAERVDVPVIASGGAGTLQHLVDGIRAGKADAVLAASIFHFGQYTIAEAKAYMRAAGIPVR
ncbi:MAG: imidazole glycerol phosphate synthase subunit HisF [Firmicutes bacterium ZCTH02-B6]|nr:MAG: imidazole glycerol phosphate synthase subunit HisF [Firmicutes bacterium ZCTH02-B6]